MRRMDILCEFLVFVAFHVSFVLFVCRRFVRNGFELFRRASTSSSPSFFFLSLVQLAEVRSPSGSVMTQSGMSTPGGGMWIVFDDEMELTIRRRVPQPQRGGPEAGGCGVEPGY